MNFTPNATNTSTGEQITDVLHGLFVFICSTSSTFMFVPIIHRRFQPHLAKIQGFFSKHVVVQGPISRIEHDCYKLCNIKDITSLGPGDNVSSRAPSQSVAFDRSGEKKIRSL